MVSAIIVSAILLNVVAPKKKQPLNHYVSKKGTHFSWWNITNLLCYSPPSAVAPSNAIKPFSAVLSHPAGAGGGIQTLDFTNMSWVFYHCPTGAHSAV